MFGILAEPDFSPKAYRAGSGLSEMLPLVMRLVGTDGWADAVVDRFLTPGERAGWHMPTGIPPTKRSRSARRSPTPRTPALRAVTKSLPMAG